MELKPRIVIVGGGIAGMAAAYTAVKLAPQAQVVLLEAGSRWGGKITTERIPHDGGHFIIEGGPDTFLATKPWGVALSKELGLGERLHGTNPQNKNTYVLHRGQLRPLPDGLAMMIPSDVPSILRSHLISWPGKLRMGLDFLLPAHSPNGDESLGRFVSRRLGREAYENLIEPLMSGIYAGDGDALSLASTFPYLRDLELKHGSLARGALKMRQQGAQRGQATTGSRSAFLTPTTGLSEIIDALLLTLQDSGVELHLNTPIQQVQPEVEGYRLFSAQGQSWLAHGLILATPAPVSGRLLRNLDPTLAAELESVEYVSTATVSLAYRQQDLPRPLDGYGYVIPRREGRKALACTWTSTKFPHRAPQGYALLRVFIGRAGQDAAMPRDEASLLDIAREEVRLTLGVQAEPLLSRVFVWEEAMPQYNLGHPARLQRIETCLAHHSGLALAGNGYRGIGIPDCIHSGELAAQSISNILEKHQEHLQALYTRAIPA